jgi:hypothetical protein
VSGVPHFEQKPRQLRLDEWKILRSPRVHSSPYALTNGPKKPPNAFWHIRQWQIEARPKPLALYRTAPHWQPPVISSIIGLIHLHPLTTIVNQFLLY